MANVVNLNKFRKRKAKAERQKSAEVNRRVHGRTKAERAREALQKQRLSRLVEGARLDAPTLEAPTLEAPTPKAPRPSAPRPSAPSTGEGDDSDVTE